MNISDKDLISTKDDPDWFDILKIDELYFPFPWKASDWLDIELSRNFLFKFNKENQLIGFCLINFVIGDEVVHLQKICLKPEFRGDGAAVLFFEKIKCFLKKLGFTSIYLEVQTINQRAINFYVKCGFSTLRIIKNFYSNGDDAQTMSIVL